MDIFTTAVLHPVLRGVIIQNNVPRNNIFLAPSLAFLVISSEGVRKFKILLINQLRLIVATSILFKDTCVALALNKKHLSIF